MARGWESKSVESQKDDARGAGQREAAASADERRRRQRRRGLELARTRAQAELDATTAPVRRAALESALAHLDGELAKLARE